MSAKKISGGYSQTSPDASTKPVAHLQALLGPEAILIPVPKGKKAPKIPAWQNTTIAAMQSEEYVATLNNGGNIAVLLGAASRGICSIDLDDDGQVEPFLALNPKLSGSLRTKGRRGCNIWVKLEGEYPTSGKITGGDGKAWGEWRASGSITVIYGKHPNGMMYAIVNNAPPVSVRFEEINWPKELSLPWAPQNSSTETVSDVELRQKFGEPVFWKQRMGGEKYIRGINQAFWAALYAAENKVIFDPDEQRFFLYSPGNGLFSIVSEDMIKQAISNRIREYALTNAALADLERFRDNATLVSIVAQLRGIVERRGAFCDRQRIVHLRNGVLRFDKMSAELLPFSPSFLSRNGSPIPYVRDAGCPRFLNELVIPAVHAEDVILLQKMAGLFLLGDNIIQRILILSGLAERGKSVFSSVMQKLVGMQNTTQLRTQHLHERFELHRFMHKTLLVGVDVDANFLASKGASVIKGLVGGDFFDTEQKGRSSSFQFRGNFNIIMTSNSRPRVRLQDDDAAWRRRLLIVPFEAPTPPRRIPNFDELLINEEGSGILNWALEGLCQLNADINNSGNINLTTRQLGLVDALLYEADSLRHFLSTRVRGIEGSNLTVHELVQAYFDYCDKMGWGAPPKTVIQQKLPPLMLELFRTPRTGDIKRGGKNQRGFRRVGWVAQEAKSHGA